MRVDVYDTYATTAEGQVIHFDVLIASGRDSQKAYEHAEYWLRSINQENVLLRQEECRFCHQENASASIARDIETKGFHIIQMEGCPNPA